MLYREMARTKRIYSTKIYDPSLLWFSEFPYGNLGSFPFGAYRYDPYSPGGVYCTLNV